MQVTTPICFKTGRVTKAEVLAIKALHEGVADEYQQRLALMTIVNKFSRAHDMQFVPGAPDESNVLTGRAFVGAQVLRCVKMKVGQLQNYDEEQEQ
jgi:hypothetical protein